MKISNDIEAGISSWSDLFSPSDFFYRYRHFIQIVGACKDQDKFKMWSGFVESKIRLLVLKLEQVITLVSAPPFPEGFSKNILVKDGEHIFKNLQYSEPSEFANADEKKNLETEEGELTFTISFYIALEIQPASGIIPIFNY